MTPPEINFAITEKVMELATYDGDGPEVGHGKSWINWWEVPSYCVEMSAAWRVVERLLGMGWAVEVSVWPGGESAWCNIQRDIEDSTLDDRVIRMPCDTAPMAICLAALKAVGVEL